MAGGRSAVTSQDFWAKHAPPELLAARAERMATAPGSRAIATTLHAYPIPFTLRSTVVGPRTAQSATTYPEAPLGSRRSGPPLRHRHEGLARARAQWLLSICPLNSEMPFSPLVLPVSLERKKMSQ